MPPEERPVTDVRFTPEFKRNLRHLARKYRHIRSDVQPIIEQLELGETPGDQISRTGYTVYKVRCPNTDARRGKRGGYRLIYYLPGATSVMLVTIYSKTEQGDVTASAVRKIIAEFEASSQ